MHHLIPHLCDLGLSEKESQVYLAALELGESGVQEIVLRSNVGRGSVYAALEVLCKKNLVSGRESPEAKTLYLAHSPEALRHLLEEEKRALEARHSDVEKMIPMLLALFNVKGERPLIRYLEGLDGMREVREMFLEQKGDAFQIVPIDDVEAISALIEKREEELGRFLETGRVRALIVGDADRAKTLPVLPGAQVRLLPKELFPIHAEITVRGNTLFLYSYKNGLLAVIITNEEIASAANALFELAWKGAAEFPGIGQ